MKPLRKSVRLLAACLALLLTACSSQGPTPEEPALLEFPGVSWNTPMEDVIESLGLTEEQIQWRGLVQETETVSLWGLRAEGVACLGGTAAAEFQFLQYLGPELDNHPGLSKVSLEFQEGTNMDTVLKELTRFYGEGSQERPPLYGIQGGKVVSSAIAQEGVMRVNLPDGTSFTCRRTPNEHNLYWAARGRSLLPEGIEASIGALFSGSGDPPSQETVLQFLDQAALVELSWSDGYLLEDGSVHPNDKVVFDGQMYLDLIQRCA